MLLQNIGSSTQWASTPKLLELKESWNLPKLLAHPWGLLGTKPAVPGFDLTAGEKQTQNNLLCSKTYSESAHSEEVEKSKGNWQPIFIYVFTPFDKWPYELLQVGFETLLCQCLNRSSLPGFLMRARSVVGKVYGTVGRAVASHTKNPRIKSRHCQKSS